VWRIEAGMNAERRSALSTAEGLPLVVGCLAALGMTAKTDQASSSAIASARLRSCSVEPESVPT
jgi:hypothetical protein